tara:strand:- start:308 stop:880 length:573 start_codon:yes stop_codon:yes gene_type:complete
MKSKILIQIFLFFVVIIISLFVYQKYLKDDQIDKVQIPSDNLNKDERNNVIKELEYESSDDQGRKYIITSEEGSIDDNNSEIILMKNVKAKIVLADGTIVNISSKRAKYNNKSFNTNFEKDVKLNFLNHNVSSQNLDLLFDENKIEVYNNLIYKNFDLTMMADKVEIDMLTKYSKIFNFDDSKVKIKKIK